MNISSITSSIAYQDLFKAFYGMQDAYNVFIENKLNEIQSPFLELFLKLKASKNELSFAETCPYNMDYQNTIQYYPGVEDHATLFLFGAKKFKKNFWFSYLDINNQIVMNVLKTSNSEFKNAFLVETGHNFLENREIVKNTVEKIKYSFDIINTYCFYCYNKNDL